MTPTTRLKIIGDDEELKAVENAAIFGVLPFKKFSTVEDACEEQADNPADVFVLGSSQYYQVHLNQIQKLDPQPEVILATGKKLPNLAKILIPRLIYADWRKEEILWSLAMGADSNKKHKRLEALRDHHKRSWNLNDNPAINLVTALMRKCTVAEDYGDLLNAVSALQSVIDFQDASLLILDGNQVPIEAWGFSKEQKEKMFKFSKMKKTPYDLGVPEGEVISFSSDDTNKTKWDPIAQNPWSFGIAIKFSQGGSIRGNDRKRSAVLVLYRRELLPFLERDFWLLEMTYGPLALALEKISILSTIGEASKEWRATFDGISEPLTVIDANYSIVKANKAFAGLVNQDIKKVKGKRCFTLLANRRSPCIGCPVTSESEGHGGTRIRWQGKEKKDLLVWSYGIRTGTEGYHFQFYRNVSKETLLASTLIQSEKMAALGKIVGAIAHEINNPLAGILATSQILLLEGDELKLENSVKEDLEEIRSAAWRSKKIIEDLLGFTSSEGTSSEETNILDAVRATLTFSKSALQNSSVQIYCEEKNPISSAPTHLIQQILFNLITNAAQAMNGKGSLNIRITRTEKFFRVDVEDSGPGIPQDKLKNIFDPFFTSKMEGVGTGLGLSIVRNLSVRIGAKIEVHSTLGKGTTFTLFLPLKEGHSSG